MRTKRIDMAVNQLWTETYSTVTIGRGIRQVKECQHVDSADSLKRVFKLAEIDQKSADLAADQHDLDQILQASVPGLVSKSQGSFGLTRTDNLTTSDGPAAGHKLLVQPNVFNISSLLPPSLSFLQRLKDIVPHDSDIAMSTLTSFLDEFIINVFHPQLEETVTELCTQAFLELDAFQQDPQWSQHSTRPIFKVWSETVDHRFSLTSSGHIQFLRIDPVLLQIARYYTPRSDFYAIGYYTIGSLL